MTEESKIQRYKGGALQGMRNFSAGIGNWGSPATDDEVDFRYVLRVLRDRRRTIMAAVATFLFIAVVVTLLMKPAYRSHATLEIREAMPDIQTLQQLQSPDAAPSEVEVATEIGILKSDGLAREVIDQLHLDTQHRSTFSLSGLAQVGWRAVSRWWKESTSGSPSSAATAGTALAETETPQASAPSTAAPEMDPKAYQELVNSFESSLKAERIGNSRLIKVSFESNDPHLSAQVVNSIVGNYLQLHETGSQKLSKELAQQVQEMKQELEGSEQKMSQYAHKNGLLYLQAADGSSQNILDQRIRQIQDELIKAQADRYQKESVYKLVQKGDYGSLPGSSQDNVLVDLMVQVAALKRQYAELSATFTDNYPKVKQVKTQLAAMEQSLARERQRAAASITNEYLASVQREALLLRQFHRLENAASAEGDKSNQYNILKRNVDSDNHLYDNLLQRVKEASLVARLRADNVSVVDSATPHYLPIRPKILLNLVLGLIVGLGIGVCIAFLQEHLDTSLRSIEDVDRFLGVPALATIPAAESLPLIPSNGNHDTGDHLVLPRAFDASVLTSAEKPWFRIDKQFREEYSPLVDAFRTLGSSVLLEAKSRNQVLRSIVVCSSQPGEGKTTVSVNLAIALAQQGKRVVLIDADLRRPSIHRALGYRNIHGLSSYLAGKTDWVSCLLPGLTPGLDTLTAGRTHDNPVALLSSSRMKTLISQALEEYEYVIVDSPALMINLSDARILAGLVDGTIMVVRSGMAPREHVLRSRKSLTNLVGVVLNSMDVHSMEDYYGYQTYYGHTAAPGDGEEKSEGSVYEKRLAGS